MKVGYEYFYKNEDLSEQLKIKRKKLIGEYIYSYHSKIKIYHEIQSQNTLEFSYLIFEFLVDDIVVKTQENLLQKNHSIYYQIQQRMESFFYGILVNSGHFFKEKKWETYAYMMHYDTMFKEELAFVFLFEDIVFNFKIWNNLSDYNYNTISNFWKEKKSCTRVCITMHSEYDKTIIRKKHLEEIMVYHIKSCINKDNRKINESNKPDTLKYHSNLFDEHLYNILLDVI